MFNYVKSELYRAFRQKGYFIFLAICLGIIGFTGVHTESIESYVVSLTAMSTMGFSIFFMVIAVLNFKPVPVQRQIYSVGTPKSRLYFGDFISQLIILYLFQITIIVAVVIVGYVKFGQAVAYNFWYAMIYDAIFVPVMVATTNSIMHVLNKQAIGTTVVTVIHMVLPFFGLAANPQSLTWKICSNIPTLRLMSLNFSVQHYDETAKFSLVQLFDSQFVTVILPILVANFVVFMALGFLFVKKREY